MGMFSKEVENQTCRKQEEPQLSLTSTHQCQFPQTKFLINIFLAWRASKIAAEGAARNIKNNLKKPQKIRVIQDTACICTYDR